MNLSHKTVPVVQHTCSTYTICSHCDATVGFPETSLFYQLLSHIKMIISHGANKLSHEKYADAVHCQVLPSLRSCVIDRRRHSVAYIKYGLQYADTNRSVTSSSLNLQVLWYTLLNAA